MAWRLKPGWPPKIPKGYWRDRGGKIKVRPEYHRNSEGRQSIVASIPWLVVPILFWLFAESVHHSWDLVVLGVCFELLGLAFLVQGWQWASDCQDITLDLKEQRVTWKSGHCSFLDVVAVFTWVDREALRLGKRVPETQRPRIGLLLRGNNAHLEGVIDRLRRRADADCETAKDMPADKERDETHHALAGIEPELREQVVTISASSAPGWLAWLLVQRVADALQAPLFEAWGNSLQLAVPRGVELGMKERISLGWIRPADPGPLPKELKCSEESGKLVIRWHTIRLGAILGVWLAALVPASQLLLKPPENTWVLVAFFALVGLALLFGTHESGLGQFGCRLEVTADEIRYQARFLWWTKKKIRLKDVVLIAPSLVVFAKPCSLDWLTASGKNNLELPCAPKAAVWIRDRVVGHLSAEINKP